MLTAEERIRALKCNLKNYDWTVSPQFRLEKEDAEVLLELLSLKDWKDIKELLEKVVYEERINNFVGDMQKHDCWTLFPKFSNYNKDDLITIKELLDCYEIIISDRKTYWNAKAFLKQLRKGDK